MSTADIDPEFLASKVPDNTQEELNTKTLRRSVQKLYLSNVEADKEHLDRSYIAFYRLQTEGRVAYRRFIGTHGGGGGAPNVTKKSGKQILYNRILARKVQLDVKHHYDNVRSDGIKWPDPSPTAAEPQTFSRDEGNLTPFTYTFCWHGRVEFTVWHRPMMREFERLLQAYDPMDLNEADRHIGPKALGLLYWGWEDWDGDRIPDFANAEEYTIRTDKFKDFQGGIFAKGTKIRNPYRRWIAPVSVEDQLKTVFPDISEKPTLRNGKFDENGYGLTQEFPWDQGQDPTSEDRPLGEIVQLAMTEPRFRFFSSTEFVGKRSIEHPHNKFHNYVGGAQPAPSDQMGTMTTNQSPFDPIFMLHHGNIERQLSGWQRKFWSDNNPWKEISAPPQVYAERRLFPWTKPTQLENGKSFWNTRPGTRLRNYPFTGSLQDWFDADLTYIYEDYVQPPESGEILSRDFDLLELVLKEYIGGGNLTLWLNNAICGVLSTLGTKDADCSNCNSKRNEYKIRFPLEDFAGSGGIEAALTARKEQVKEPSGGNITDKREDRMMLRLKLGKKDITNLVDWDKSKVLTAKQELNGFLDKVKEAAENQVDEPESPSDIEEENALAEQEDDSTA